ncbi:MAG: hypothetical protein MZV65_43775 [Chromatiales bacterium]|nr:hypothetical protein [Chromatiales bacterium]
MLFLIILESERNSTSGYYTCCLTGVMVLSALLFQSKTMRAMIFVPIAIGVASRFGLSVISLALPVAFMIEHVYVLPFNSKPACIAL